MRSNSRTKVVVYGSSENCAGRTAVPIRTPLQSASWRSDCARVGTAKEPTAIVAKAKRAQLCPKSALMPLSLPLAGNVVKGTRHIAGEISDSTVCLRQQSVHAFH